MCRTYNNQSFETREFPSRSSKEGKKIWLATGFITSLLRKSGLGSVPFFRHFLHFSVFPVPGNH